MRRNTKSDVKQVALERIHILFKEAIDICYTNMDLASRYVYLARKLSMKANVRIPSEYRRLFCHKCYVYLLPSKNCTVRIKEKQIHHLCLNCGQINRFVIKKP